MNTSFEGKLTAIMPAVEVPTQDGRTSTKQQIIIEEENAQFPDSVAVTLWNEHVTNFHHVVGDRVTAYYHSRVYKTQDGTRAFVELKAWRVD